MHVGRRLPEDLPVHLSARSDEGGEQSSRTECGPAAFHMRAECMRARAEQRPHHNLHRDALEEVEGVEDRRMMMLVDCRCMYVR